MIWYRINDRWMVNLAEARSFGIYRSDGNEITIDWKDGSSEQYTCEYPAAELKAMEAAVLRINNHSDTYPFLNKQIVKYDDVMERHENGLV